MPKFFINNYDVARVAPQYRIPIAAKSEEAIAQYVGAVKRLRRGNSRTGHRVNALEVRPRHPPSLPSSHPFLKRWGAQFVFNTNEPQYWVHVDNRAYRKHFEADAGMVTLEGIELDLDHVLSANIARENHLRFVRLSPVSSSANRSAGGGIEKFQAEWLREERGANSALKRMTQGDPDPYNNTIAFAGALALCKMLGEKPGSVETLPGLQEVESVMHGHGQ